MQIINTTPTIKRVLNTKKKSIGVLIVDSYPYTANTVSYWDGGSRDIYVARNLANGAYDYPPTGHYPTFDAQYTVPMGYVLINSGIFQGKPSRVYLTVYRDDLDKLNNWLGTSIK